MELPCEFSQPPGVAGVVLSPLQLAALKKRLCLVSGTGRDGCSLALVPAVVLRLGACWQEAAEMCHLGAECLGKALNALKALSASCKCGFVFQTRANSRCKWDFFTWVRTKKVGIYRAVRAGSVLPNAFPGKRSLGFYPLSSLCNREAGKPGASIHMADSWGKWWKDDMRNNLG